MKGIMDISFEIGRNVLMVVRYVPVRQVRHKEGRHEREPSRLNDETAVETENRAVHEYHG